MAEKSFASAMIDALSFSLAKDPNVIVVGASSFLLDRGLSEEEEQKLFKTYGDRLIDPPTSESLVASLGIGAASAGLRPFVNFGTASFAFEACNQIVNEAGNLRYMSGGKLAAPVVFHMFHGIRGRGGAQHSQSPQAMYANCAGLRIVLPSTPADAQGLLRTALEISDPTIFVTHTKLLKSVGAVPEGDYRIPYGKAEIKREGRDVTVVATSLMVQEALQAAAQLAAEKIEVEVLDPRTISPFDYEALRKSLQKTGRLVVVDEANRTCSIASEIAATAAEQCFEFLKAPILRVARADAPIAYSPPLEDYATPGAQNIVSAVRKVCGAKES
jgi:acetoin:2,6-dichlorophenolindophenol oxidoreductase subunit beta